jgi:hypothetical protein
MSAPTRLRECDKDWPRSHLIESDCGKLTSMQNGGFRVETIPLDTIQWRAESKAYASEAMRIFLRLADECYVHIARSNKPTGKSHNISTS